VRAGAAHDLPGGTSDDLHGAGDGGLNTCAALPEARPKCRAVLPGARLKTFATAGGMAEDLRGAYLPEHKRF
jgi:hypothetical protein